MWSENFQFGEPSLEKVVGGNKDSETDRVRAQRKNVWYKFAVRVAGFLHQNVDTLWNKGYAVTRREPNTVDNELVADEENEEDAWVVYSPELVTHVEQAFTMVTCRWKHLKDLKLKQIMETPKVSVLFAQLVFLLMRNNAWLSQKRYMLQKAYRMTNNRIQKTLYMFSYVQIKDGGLIVRGR